jgi:Cys-tRNA(Pro)/Cys-tRNA(Cys) deacylase
MTPGIRQAKKAGIPFEIKEYQHDPNSQSYGEEAASALGVAQSEVFKTLLAQSNDGKLIVAIVPVAGTLDLKALAKASGCKKMEMADPIKAEKATGYVVGGISPLGQKKQLPTFIDSSAQDLTVIHVSAGKRGLEISLKPEDLLKLTRGKWASIGRGD